MVYNVQILIDDSFVDLFSSSDFYKSFVKYRSLITCLPDRSFRLVILSDGCYELIFHRHC